MLYQLLDLQRDSGVRGTTFGASSLVGYDFGRSYRELISPSVAARLPRDETRGWDQMLTVGLTVAFDGPPRQLPLFKSVELWTESAPGGRERSSPRPPGRPAILERLLYQTAKGLVPYCWRYIDPRFGSSTLVHCANLETVHGELQGLTNLLSVQDPRQIYMDTLADMRGSYPEERFHELQNLVRGSNHGGRFSRHAFVPEEITQVLMQMTRGLSWSFDADWERRTPKHSYYEFMAPAYRIDDPISQTAPVGPVSTELLMKYYVAPPFDVSPPQPLVIRHPNVTAVQDRACRLLAQALDPVRLTDYSISFSVVNGVPYAHRWERAVNRYLALFDTEANRNIARDQATLYNVAQLAFRCAAFSSESGPVDVDLLDEAEVSITKTFGEEALVSISRHGEVVVAYYIDFALQAFCSMGLSVDSPSFRADPGVSQF